MIDPEEVDRVFVDCLFREEEVKDGKPVVEPVKAEGIVSAYGFHPERLNGHAAKIIGWLHELPAGFHEKTSGGWTFLNACSDITGEQWTGLQMRVEQLMCLGIAIGRVKYVLPREMWKSLPGGMPYFVVLSG